MKELEDTDMKVLSRDVAKVSSFSESASPPSARVMTVPSGDVAAAEARVMFAPPVDMD